MIAISKLTKEDIGRWVVYKPLLENERGRLKSFNLEANVVFVVYSCGGNWGRFLEYTAAGTNPMDLHWSDKRGEPEFGR